MKPVSSPRAEELLVERALRPLDDKEHWELHELGAEADNSFDLAAAGVAVALIPHESMPADISAKILAASPARSSGPLTTASIRTLPGVGPQLIQPTQPRTDIEVAREKKRSRLSVAAPWLAAAACLMAASGAWLWARDQAHRTQTAALSPTAARAQLLAHATDVATITWTPTADETAHGATGDIVWSQTEQRGFMRFVGLAVNDARQFQYQLWIFDKTRDAAFPIDGGVFDVSSTGEVIIPISAKLAVGDATLFAVTVEKPGGVVVSKRERIVVTAARKS